MSEKTRKIAVLTGDIVGSTALGPEKLERAFDALRDCAEMQAEWMGESLRFTRHRGDGWQVALAEPKYALRSALAFRAALRAEGSEFDSYIGIAEGEVSGPLEANLNDETDDVFATSGQLLEEVKEQDFTIKLAHASGGPIFAATLLADQISHEWTPTQAAAILPMMHPTKTITYTKVAESLGKTRQSVTKSLDAARYPHLKLALGHIEETNSPYV